MTVEQPLELVRSPDGIRTGIPDTEAKLVADIMLCRFESLAAVYDEHSVDVHGLALRLCGDDEAEEVVRNVFLAFWRAPNAYDANSGGITEYLTKLTFAAAVAHRRRRATVDDRVHDGSRRADLAEGVGRTASDALAELPPTLRNAIAAAHLSGYTYSEIAELLAQVDIDVTPTSRRRRTGTSPLGRRRRSLMPVSPSGSWMKTGRSLSSRDPDHPA